MSDLEHVRSRAQADDDHPVAAVFQDLLSGLEGGASFSLDRLYALPYGDFEVALGALREWWSIRRIEGAPGYGCPDDARLSLQPSVCTNC